MNDQYVFVRFRLPVTLMLQVA